MQLKPCIISKNIQHILVLVIGGSGEIAHRTPTEYHNSLAERAWGNLHLDVDSPVIDVSPFSYLLHLSAHGTDKHQRVERTLSDVADSIRQIQRQTFPEIGAKFSA
jgi:hypothetical protein